MLPTYKLARLTLGLVTLVFSLSRKVILTIRQTAQRSEWHNSYALKHRLGVKIALAGVLCLLIGSGFYASTSAQGLGVPQFTQGFSQRFAGAISAKLNAWGFGARANPNAANTAFACTLTQTVTVSGCYYTGGSSKATVSVEVGWTGAVNGNTITVSLDSGAQTRTIKPESLFDPGSGSAIAGPIVTPQVVAFEITADGLAHTIDVSLAGVGGPCSATQETFTAPAACVPNLCTTGELGGTVFFDYNANGVKETGEFNGAAGVTVTAIDKNGATYTATSDSAGRYEFSAANSNAIATADYPVRLEFTNLPALGFNTTTPSGTSNGTSVQFASAAQCSVDVGVMDQNGFCQANPLVILPCYVNGDPAPNVNTSDAGDVDALIAFPYNIANGGPTPASMSHLATARQVGSLWGVSYNKFTKRLFTSAMLRRHVGLGPLGLGGMYVTNLSNPAVPTTSNFIDITTLGVNVGTAPNVATRGLVPNKLAPNYDTAVYGLVGKVGIGDMDIAEDGNKLWFVNLNDQKLYGLDITSYNTSSTLPTAADVSSTAIPSPGCANGVHRPWGTKFYKGRVYVGSVCDASSGTRSDLKARVSAYDPVANSWSTVFDFPLTYPKGYPFLSSAGVTAKTGWYAWTDNFTTAMTPTAAFGGGQLVIHPQPMLSDIEFDLDGSMVLAIGDRNSMQIGYFNYGPNSPSTTLYLSSVGGDVLRAYSSGNAFVLENNGKAGPVSGSGVGNFQGPGFGEFYNDNWSIGGNLFHTEHSIGALAIRPGSGETINVAIDPVNETFNAGGVRFLNNTTGTTNKAYSVYAGSSNSADGLFGKATGLGDVELACASVSYLEIGNRIWMDTDSDGVQDPDEMPIAGVTVHAYTPNGRDGVAGNADDLLPIATAVTNVDGEYYFTSRDTNSDNLPDSDAALTDNVGLIGGGSVNPTYPAIQPFTRYVIRLDRAADFQTGGALFGKAITAANADSGTFGTPGDLHDSDFGGGNVMNIAGGNFPEIEAQHLVSGVPTNGTGAFGQVDHTFDAGFAPTLSLGNRVWKDLNNSGTIDAADGASPGVDGVVVRLLNSPALTPAAPDQTTAGGGYYRFDNLAPGDYVVEIRALNFTGAGVLKGCVSSGTDAGDPDTDVDDSDDNGQGIAPDVTNGIRSAAITLSVNGEPLNDNDPATNPVAGEATNGNSNRTVDFGFAPTFSLGNRVWKDTDNSGTLNGTESGVNGVIVKLLKADLSAATDISGNPVANQTTANGGYYRFDNLPAGDYVIEIVASNFTGTGMLTGCVSSGPVAGDPDIVVTDSDDNGTGIAPDVANGIRSLPVTLGPAPGSEPTNETDLGTGDPTEPNGNTNLTVDFGFVPTFSLGNRVWKDVDNSGTINAADTATPGVNGVIVKLLKADLTGATDSNGAAVPNQTTANGGYYRFDNLLPGDYVAEIVASNFTSTGALFNCASSRVNEADPDSNGDSNDNGLDAPVSGAIQSAPVTLGPAPGTEPTTESDLATGDPTEPNGNTNQTVDFGFIPTFSLGNRVWKDLDNSGTINAADGATPGVNGVVVRLLKADGVTVATDINGVTVPNQTTANGGYYRFDNLAAGDYIIEIVAGNFGGAGTLFNCVSSRVTEADPDGGADSNDNGADAPVSGAIQAAAVTLGPGPNTEPTTETDLAAGDPVEPNASTNLTVDFGFVPTFSLGNRIWKDLDNSGTINGTEAGVDGVIVRLLKADGVTAATDINNVAVPNQTTANSGFFRFSNIPAGDFIVEVVASNFASAGVLFNCVSSVPQGNDADTDVDDSDDNGVNTPVSGAIQTLPVTLGPAPNSEPTTETNLGPTDPAEPNGGTNMTVDLGFAPVYSLGNRVWKDTDNSGTLNGTEGGVDGVVLKLLKADLTAATDINGAAVPNQTTANGGYYKFTNLGAGDFIVEVLASNFTTTGALFSCTSSVPTAGDPDTDVDDSDDNGTGVMPDATNGIRSQAVTLGPNPNSEPTTETDLGAGDPTEPNGSTNMTLDFGFVPVFTLGNRVWKDLDNSGTLNGTESGVDGVVLRLLKSDGTTVATDINGANVPNQTTANGGFYRFINLPSGDFIVEVAASNFASTGVLWNCVSSVPESNDPDVDTDDKDDNGVNVPVSGAIQTLPVTLGPGPNTEPANETDLGPGDPAEPNSSTNLTIDFGFAPIYSLGNRIWKDQNNNALLDGAEAGVNGVVVKLLKADLTAALDINGVAVPNQTTANGGYYRFTNLPTGDFIVEIVASNFTGTGALLGCVSSVPVAADPDTVVTDSDDNGVGVVPNATTGIQSLPITLGNLPNSEPTNETDLGTGDPTEPNGSTNLTLDFGFVPPMSLGNTVWMDSNNNGAIDATELGKDGARVELFFDANGNGTLEVAEQTVVATQTTSGGGRYLFTTLTNGNPLTPGKYFVGIAASNFTTGGMLIGFSSSGTTISNAGAVSEAVIAANGATDSDADNKDDGAKVTAAGFYQGGVLSGVVMLVAGAEPTNETTEPGAVTGGVTPTLANTYQGAAINDNNSNVTVDFGFYNQCLGDIVFHDNGAGNLANNGVKDAGENGLSGIVVKLFAANATTELNVGPDGILGSADDVAGGVVTGTNGEYKFAGLPAGDYVVKITAPNGATSSSDVTTSGTPNNSENTPDDDNGTGFGGGTITSGAITLTPGTANATEGITVTAGVTNNPTLDFALILTPPVSLGNTVWLDLNNDGQINNGEVGKDGVLVELFLDANGNGTLEAGAERTPVARQLTSGGGYYLFTQTTDAAGLGTGTKLVAASYLIGISPFNFSVGLAGAPVTIGGKPFVAGMMAGYQSSATNISNLGVMTDGTAASSADANLDNGEDGLKQNGSSFYQLSNVFGVMSGAVLVVANGEPVTETTQPAGLIGGNTPPNDVAMGYPMGHANTINGTAATQTIQDDESNVTVDFGFYQQCLGDLAFNDDGAGTPANYNNALKDALEAGLKDVVVKLFAVNGTTEINVGPDGIVGTLDDAAGGILSLASGAYKFAGLPQGDYKITVTVPTGFKSSNDIATTANPNNGENTPDDDNGIGAATTTATTGVITMTPGTVNAAEGITATPATGTTNNPTVDFALRPQGFSIGNTVFADVNNNGAIEPMEKGLPNVKVWLFFDANYNGSLDVAEQTPYAVVTTNVNGYYLFTESTNAAGVVNGLPLLPGMYWVGIAPMNFVSGGVLQNWSSSGTSINNTGSVSETLIAGNQVSNDDKDNFDDGVKTASGFFAGGIMSNKLTLAVISEPLNETTAGMPGATGGATPGFTNAVNGEAILDSHSNITVDFGFYAMSLGNLVFIDRNNDALFVTGDPVMPNVNVRLLAGDGVTVLATTTSDANGRYCFPGLVEGEFFVQIDLPNGFVSSKDIASSSSPSINPDNDDNGLNTNFTGTTVTTARILLDAGAAPTGEADNGQPINGLFDSSPDADANKAVDFALTRHYSLGNRVWRDLNNNGSIDVADGATPGVDGVKVRLFFANGSPALDASGVAVPDQTTRNGGFYRFDRLAEGDYIVEVIASNFTTGNPLAGLTSSTGKNNIVGPFESAPDPDNDADSDDNGSMVVTGARSAAISLGNGTGIIEPAAEANIESPNPTGESPNNQSNLTADFGFTPLMTLGNLVWKDLDNDGVKDATEVGVGNVTVELYADDGNGVFNKLTDTLINTATTLTVGNIGEFSFTNLVAGNYFIHVPTTNFGTGKPLDFCLSSTATEADPNGNTDSNDNGVDSPTPITTGITTGLITLNGDGEPTTDGDGNNGNQTVDLGFFKPFSLGNLVWKDLDDDGVKDATEPGVDGVLVELFKDRNANGVLEVTGADAPALRTTTTTNANGLNGLYNFTELEPGDYFVRIAASNFAAAGVLVGCTSSTPSEANPNDNVDNNDNGVNSPTPAVDGIASGKITLTPNGEPDTPVDGDGTFGNQTVDFGFFTPVNVGNLIWKDYDNDGKKDATEPGIDLVTVELLRDTNDNGLIDATETAVVATTQTANGGVYSFSNLMPGNYVVRIAASNFATNNSGGAVLAGCLSSTATESDPNMDEDSNDNGLNNPDPATNGISSGVIELVSDEPTTDGDGASGNLTIDFGIYPPLSLGNLIFKDQNNNGVKDANEAGVDGVVVELFRDNGDGAFNAATDTLQATTTTAGGGLYQFAVTVSTDYFVRIVASNFNGNGVLTGCFSSTTTEANPNDDLDNNDNGIDSATPATTGIVTGKITIAGNTEPTTDGDGANSNQTIDFGFFAPVTLGNLIWKDFDNDGVKDATEPGMDGVIVELFRDNGDGVLTAADALVTTATTAGGGLYSFTGLLPGNYFVRVAAVNFTAGKPLEGCLSSTTTTPSNSDVDGDDNGVDAPTPATTGIATSVISLLGGTEPVTDGDGANANQTIDLGFFAPLSLGNAIWKDVNNNGLKDATEAGINGVIVELLRDANNNGTIDASEQTAVATATTVNGAYSFTNLLPGNYVVRVAASNFTGTGALLGCVSSSGAQPDPNTDTDNDDNGIDNPNPAVNGISTGIISLIGNTEPTNDSDGPNGNQTIDLGFVTPANLGNLVWKDLDNDGVKDATEAGVDGVTVELLRDLNGNNAIDANEQTAIATQLTASGGKYLFLQLGPGTYFVRLAASNFATAGALANCFSSTVTVNDANTDLDNDDNGVDNPTPAAGGITSGPVVLLAGTEPTNDGDDANSNATVDFGLYPPMTLGNAIWKDFNNNGLKDTNEPAVDGVTVELLRDANNNGTLDANELTAIATTTTANGGTYSFTVAPGAYFLRIAASNFVAGAPLAGCLSSTTTTNPNTDINDDDNGVDNPTPATGGIVTGVITLVGGSEPTTDGDGNNGNQTIDFGFYAPLTVGNLIWKDYDNDGTKDANEPGVDNVLVELIRDTNGNGTLDSGDGAAVATATTTSGGTYSFTGVLPGNHFVKVAASNFATSPNPGPLSGCLSSTVTNPNPNSDTDNDDNGIDNPTPTTSGVATGVITLIGNGEPTTDGDGANGNQTIDLGFYPPLTIGNSIWKDLNNNGLKDATEAGVNGATVELLRDANGNSVLDAAELTAIATTTTVNGAYQFTGLTPGAYFVRVAASNFIGSGALIGCLSSTPTTNDPNNDAENDDNGIDNPTPSTGGIVTGVINVSGNTEPTNDGDGPHGNQTIDLGFFTPATVGNLIWKDTDNNGKKDVSEAGVDGVKVEIFRDVNGNGSLDVGDGVALATTTTANGGLYSFSGLLPSGYFVRVASTNFGAGKVLSDCVSSGVTSPDPNNDVDNDDNGLDSANPATTGITTGVITIQGGSEPTNDGDPADSNLTIDLGFAFPGLSLGDLVWKDLDRNGRKDGSEPVIANVKINLYRDVNGNGVYNSGVDTLVTSTTTSSTGQYAFTGLTPANYFAEVDASNFAASGVLYNSVSTPGAPNANSDTDNDDNGSDSITPQTQPPICTLTLTAGGEPTNDGDGSNSNQTVDFGFATLLTAKVDDPITCTGANTILQVRAELTNTGTVTLPDSSGPELVADLPATVSGVPGSCVITGGTGTCVVESRRVVFNGTVAAGKTVFLTYKIQVGSNVAPGTEFCITTTGNFDSNLDGTNDTSTSVTVCDKVDCQGAGPGAPFTGSGCSVLIYPTYTSNASNPAAGNTRIALTNTNPTESVAVHMYFVDGTSCSVADSFICLTANQTASFMTSDLDPGTSGYVMMVAVDPKTGCPTNFNYLIGDSYVKFDSGHTANLPAECSSALSAQACDPNAHEAQIRFDGEQYSPLPRTVAIDNLASRADGNDTMLILNAIGGSLATGADRLGPIFGLLYDDAEKAYSFTFSPTTCQLRARLDSTFPRTTPRYDSLIAGGRTGWMKLSAQNDRGLVGSVLNRNSNAASSSSAFSGGHNLHKLTTTNAASVTVPVFPPTC